MTESGIRQHVQHSAIVSSDPFRNWSTLTGGSHDPFVDSNLLTY
jgi:hypothetical protein